MAVSLLLAVLLCTILLSTTAAQQDGGTDGVAVFSPLIVCVTGAMGAGIAIAVLTIVVHSQKKKEITGGDTAVANADSEDFEMTLNATYNCQVFTASRPQDQAQNSIEDFEMTQNVTYNCEALTLSRPLECHPAEAIYGTAEEGYVINELFYETLPSVPEKDTENIYEPVNPLQESGEGTSGPVANGDLTNKPVHNDNHTQPIEANLETGKESCATVQKPCSAGAKELLTDKALPDDPAHEGYYVINQLNYEKLPNSAKKTTEQ